MLNTISTTYIWILRLVCGMSTLLVMYSYIPEVDAHLKPILRPFLVPHSEIIAAMAMFGVSYAVIVAVMKAMGD